MRDNRSETERTFDRGSSELRNELLVLENKRQLLVKFIQNAWQKLLCLELVRSLVNHELRKRKWTQLILTQSNGLLLIHSLWIPCVNPETAFPTMIGWSIPKM